MKTFGLAARHVLLALALSVTAGGSALAAAAKSSPLPSIDIPFQKFVLANGLTLIVHEDHKAPVVAVNIWYHVGSKDEHPGRTGFAHLFEHLMFNGSENYRDDWFKVMESAGATKLNGSTWFDRTNYFQNMPTSALDLTLWMESDRMGHLLGAIDQKVLDEQRGVVQNEKRQRQNQPYGKASELIALSTYPTGHPYSWEPIGSMEDLNAASLEDVKDWFRAYYGAANAVLVIAGDVTVAEARQKVEKYFGDIPSGPVIRRQQDWVAKMAGGHRASMQDNVPQARIYKVWNIPGYSQRDFTLIDMTSELLAGGKNSRLYKRLVYTDRTATAVTAGIGPFELGSQLEISVTVKAGGDPAAVEKVVDEEVSRLLATGPTPAELERIRTTNYANFARNIERIDGFGGKSSILAESQVYGGSPDFYKTRLDWVANATPADVQAAARRWLSDGEFVLNVTPVATYKTVASTVDRSKVPTPGAPPSLTLPAPARAKLSNGLELVVVERHSAPVVDFTLLADAGFAADASAKPGTARLTMLMLQEGTKTRDSLQIAERSESLGAPLAVGSTLDRSFLNMNALSGRLPESLDLYADVLLNPTFPAKELDRLRGQTLATIQQEKAQPAAMINRVMPALLFGEGHAYSNPASGSGTEAAIKSLTNAELAAFYKRWVRPDNSVLLVVGDTTLKQIQPLLEQRFAAWRAPAEAVPKKNLANVALAAKPRVFLIDRPGAEQSQIVAAAVAPARSDPDYIRFVALDTVLGGNFTSRLNMNLREDKHWSYGAGTRFTEALGQGMHRAGGGVQTDKTAESMVEIRKELREVLTSRPPSEDELKFAKDSIVITLPGNNETSDDIATSYGEILTYGLKDSYWNDYVGEVTALTTADVNKSAGRLVHPDALTWVVVGDLAKIEAKVRALNFGEVTIIDTDGKPVAR
ncbi:MAG TPA: pitrilysin family protein [Steroidobacteraceae bacterium]|jgi:zinc protease|nr:pitrilysin family protein [Steroidobacteraceae bacterium]